MSKVQILLSSYNGEKFIDEQIESLVSQNDVDLNILVRDDGSTDGTIAILEKYRSKGILNYYQGENLKPANSFMNLIKNSQDADYYAFCDQDDYWEANKLLKAIEMLNDYTTSPALYFSKAELVNAQLQPIKHKGYPEKAYTFGQAIIKNNATGCTMVINQNLMNVIREYYPSFITMHDYWIYLICLSIGGKVIYDNNSYIKYRQHGNNVVGGKTSFIHTYKNKFRMFINKGRDRSKMVKELSCGFSDIMTKENREIVDEVLVYTQSFKNKWKLIMNKNINSTSMKNRFMFIIAILFNAF